MAFKIFGTLLKKSKLQFLLASLKLFTYFENPFCNLIYRPYNGDIDHKHAYRTAACDSVQVYNHTESRLLQANYFLAFSLQPMSRRCWRKSTNHNEGFKSKHFEI
jgi:hypothetical protein